MKRIVLLITVFILTCQSGYGQTEPASSRERLKFFEKYVGTWTRQGALEEDSLLGRKGEPGWSSITWRWVFDRSAVEWEWVFDYGGKRSGTKGLMAWDVAHNRLIGFGVASIGGNVRVTGRTTDPFCVFVEGELPDGTTGSQVETFSLSGDDALIMQATERTLGAVNADGPKYTFMRTGTSEQESGRANEHLKPLEAMLGQWKMKGEWKDGKPFLGEETSVWCLNKNFIQSQGWFSGYDGSRVDYYIITGWDPVSRQIVEWFSFGDGGHSQRVGEYNAATRSWVSHEQGVDGKGMVSSCDVTVQFVDQDSWTWKSTNVLEGSESRPDLSFTFTRTSPSAAVDYQQWIKYLAGRWTTTDQAGVANDELVEIASGGKSLVSCGAFADGVEFTRHFGWEADTKTLVETWYLSSGTHLVNRYQEIDGQKCVGKTTIANSEGQTAHGTIVRERINDDELKSVYRGGLPGGTEGFEMTWISKRQ